MKQLLVIVLLFSVITGFAQTQDTLTTGSGLKYIKLKDGKGPKLKDGQKLKVFYTGKFLNGKQFETNRNYKPFKFVLGKKEVIPGWDEGFKLMSEGEKGILIVPADLAYGKLGVKDQESDSYHIPPNADLIFEVEVVSAK